MADDSRGRDDRIDIEREDQRREWSRKLDVTEDQLQEAVRAVGTRASDIEDHTKANQELETLASSKGVDLPDGPSLLQKGKSKLMLSTADGESFDRRYAESMGVEAHEDNIELFEKAVKEAEDPDVKAYAQKTLPKLQEHLEMARKLAGDRKDGKTAEE